VIYFGRIPEFLFLLNSLLISLSSFAIGYWYFYKNENEIIYYI
jgi:hypothetical protein